MNDIPQRSWLNQKLSVKQSSIHNLGLFGNSPVFKDEVVMILGGTVLSDGEVEEKRKRGERYDGVTLGIDMNLSIKPPDWPGIYGNHSCNPSLWMKDAITIVARREVRAGEELTTDYAMYTLHPDWSMQCNCKSILCRKVITGSDWKRADLRERYAGHFSPVIEALISKDVAKGNGRMGSDK